MAQLTHRYLKVLVILLVKVEIDLIDLLLKVYDQLLILLRVHIVSLQCVATLNVRCWY